jgi:hypothetical protein
MVKIVNLVNPLYDHLESNRPVPILDAVTIDQTTTKVLENLYLLELNFLDFLLKNNAIEQKHFYEMHLNSQIVKKHDFNCLNLDLMSILISIVDSVHPTNIGKHQQLLCSNGICIGYTESAVDTILDQQHHRRSSIKNIVRY